MKAEPVLIQWHRSQTVSSVDFSPIVPQMFATAGGDTYVRIWRILQENDGMKQSSHNEEAKLDSCSKKNITNPNVDKDGDVLMVGGSEPVLEKKRKALDGKKKCPLLAESIEFRCTLVGHTSGVNVVRWSPKGDFLASADNAGAIIIWQQFPLSPEILRNISIDEDTDVYKEVWKPTLTLSGHKHEVSDISWSPCGKYIASVGTDQKLRIWDAKRAEVLGSVHHHTEVVQGLTWDPAGQYIATQGVDRAFFIYSVKFKGFTGGRSVAMLSLVQRSIRVDRNSEVEPSIDAQVDQAAVSPGTQTQTLGGTSSNLSNIRRVFSDPTTTGISFFRRPAFSPDGLILACPAGELCRDYSDRLKQKQSSAKNGSDELDSKQNSISPKITLNGSVTTATISSSDVNMCGINISASTKANRKKREHAVILYTRRDIMRPPVACLPGFKMPPWVVRFSPVIYSQLVTGDANTPHANMFDLPYRMYMAVGCDDALAIYDTQRSYPLLLLQNFHVYRYQDIAWSCDGNALVATSHDGYCTVVVFDQGELGTPIARPSFTKSEDLQNSITPVTEPNVLSTDRKQTFDLVSVS